MKLKITNTFTNQLPADPNLENSRRQVLESVYSFVSPKKTSNPSLIHVSDEMQQKLGISEDDIHSKSFLDFVTGNTVLKGSKPNSV